MPRYLYRPSGLLGWILEHSPEMKFAFIGCIGTEDRSLSTYQQLKSFNLITKEKLFQIYDKKSKFTDLQNKLFDKRIEEFKKLGGDIKNIESHYLLERYAKIIHDIENFSSNNENIILDITSFPKRFFFPLIKMIHNNSNVQNLLITYTIPLEYSKDKMAFNYEVWAPLPLFSGGYTKDPVEVIIINVGFYPMGLQDEITPGAQGIKMKLLFPFPAPPNAVERSWKFVRKIQKYRDQSSYDLYYVSINDISAAFERISTTTDSGKKRALLAPFGPKTISCAMCLYAILTESEVYYTQPTYYNPEYSFKISKVNGLPETYAYWIRLNGKDFYSLT